MTRRLFPVAVLAVTDWTDNAELITTVAHDLGHIDLATDHVIDLTYGDGGWWRAARPDNLTILATGTDFRRTGYHDATFDVVAFDPPYVPQGGTTNTRPNIVKFRAAYGLEPCNRHQLTDLIIAGLAEATRITRPGGRILVKSMPFRSGRVLHHMPNKLIVAGERLGLDLVDELVHRRTPGPTSRDEFKNARRNESRLLIFRRRHHPAKPAPTTLPPELAELLDNVASL